MLELTERAIVPPAGCPITTPTAFAVSSVDCTPIDPVRVEVLVFAVAENDTIICPLLVSERDKMDNHVVLGVAFTCEVLVNGIAVPEVVFFAI